MAIVQGTNMDEVVFNGIDLQYRHLVLDLDSDNKKEPSKQQKKKSNYSFDDLSQYVSSVKGFVDTSKIKVPRHDDKFVKTETIKNLVDGIKRACIVRMLADINRFGLYIEENMKSIWGLHWKPSHIIVLGIRVVELTSNPLFKENHLLPSLPILGMRIMTMLNGLVHEVFVKAYYNGKRDSDGNPIVEASPLDIEIYLDAVSMHFTQYEIDAVGENFFMNIREDYKKP